MVMLWPGVLWPLKCFRTGSSLSGMRGYGQRMTAFGNGNLLPGVIINPWLFRAIVANQGINGGETGIRTLGGLAPTTVFETAPFDHSGTSPRGVRRGLMLIPDRRKGEMPV